ncbi:hypothetical protein BKA00_007215 [Actinomadura coerulea]|uniref:Uncharacterized protein n=1 Tax=Actinomadura coerulea TaxID=46159 RepID=A0A7X0G8K8_9ACTN|nr:hypothetical protein [Actinomadura coerulea]MBB6400301.1 hypothetical protein [Actinomadura coerulea]GGQ40224.1 hypothetical protein GCM10010187_67940 [Actinomadura coerulea]
MSPQLLGLLIGSGFGTAFVLANAGEPLPEGAGVAMRILAVVCLAAVVVVGFRGDRRGGTGRGDARPGWFGPRFGLVVVAEFALIFGGIAVLRALDAPQEINVAWIALIVGLHFVVLARVWKRGAIAVPGIVLSGLGAAGMIMAAGSSVEWIPFVSGALSGVTLLAGSLYGAARR